jgi:hypothetical protein
MAALNWLEVPVAILISLAAMLISAFSVFVTVIYRIKDARPWLIIKDIKLDKIHGGVDVVATIENSSGGPALNIKYKMCIESVCSDFNTDSAAIFPGKSFYLHRPTGGWDFEDNDRITFIVTYEDMYGLPYELIQVTKLPNFLLTYENRVIRNWKNLWLKI